VARSRETGCRPEPWGKPAPADAQPRFHENRIEKEVTVMSASEEDEWLYETYGIEA
jgi:hypothetical protein